MGRRGAQTARDLTARGRTCARRRGRRGRQQGGGGHHPRREGSEGPRPRPVTAVPGAPATEEGGSVEVEMESAVAPEEMEE